MQGAILQNKKLKRGQPNVRIARSVQIIEGSWRTVSPDGAHMTFSMLYIWLPYSLLYYLGGKDDMNECKRDCCGLDPSVGFFFSSWSHRIFFIRFWAVFIRIMTICTEEKVVGHCSLGNTVQPSIRKSIQPNEIDECSQEALYHQKPIWKVSMHALTCTGHALLIFLIRF